MKPLPQVHRLASILLLLVFASLASAQISITKINESRIGNQAMPLGVFALHLRAHQDDAIVSFNGYQYCVYYSTVGTNTAQRFVTVGRRQLPVGEWETVILRDYIQSSDDSHNVPVIGIAEGDGTIHLAYDHHSSALNYRRSIIGLASNPESHAWNASKFGNHTDRIAGLRLRGITYPRFFSAPNGDLQLVHREGNPHFGKNRIYTYDKTSHDWTSHGPYIDGTQVEARVGHSSPYLNPYLHGITYDSDGRLHASWVWRTSDRSIFNFDISYAYSDDRGLTWRNTDNRLVGRAGERVQDPITFQDTPTVKVLEFQNLANQTGQAIDTQGRIHISQQNGGRFLHVYRDLDGVWHSNRIPNVPAGRYKMTTDQNDNIYVISSSALVYAATASSNFSDWAIAYDGDRGRFSGDAQIDEARMKSEGILSIMVAGRGSASDIYSIDLSVSPIVEATGTYGNGGTPGTGEPWPIRSRTTTRIEAENFDQGPNGVSYNDTDPGNTGGEYRASSDVDIERTSNGGRNVGFIRAGEWLQYSFVVSANRTYDMRIRYARNPTGSTRMRVSSDGTNLGSSFAADSTGGWQDYRTLTRRIDLARGEQKFRLTFLDGSINVNYIEFVPILPPEDGPVAHWPLNEGSGTTISDASGNNHNGTLLYGPSWRSDSTRGSHLRFDGNNDRADTEFTYALSNSEDFTWSWWANNQSDGLEKDRAIMVGNRYGGPGTNDLEFIKLTRTRGEFANGSSAGRVDYPRLPTNGWHHYVMVKNGSSYQMYVDGNTQGPASTLSYGAGGAIPFKIGGDDDDNTAGGRENEHFAGFIDDVVLYDRALTNSEIAEVRAGTYEGFAESQNANLTGGGNLPTSTDSENAGSSLPQSVDANDNQQLITYATGQPLGQTPTSIDFDGQTMEYRYTRSQAAINDNMTFEVQWSASLEEGSWTSDGIIDSVDTEAPESETLEHRIATIPLGDESTRRFMRLKVTE